MVIKKIFSWGLTLIFIYWLCHIFSLRFWKRNIIAPNTSKNPCSEITRILARKIFTTSNETLLKRTCIKYFVLNHTIHFHFIYCVKNCNPPNNTLLLVFSKIAPDFAIQNLNMLKWFEMLKKSSAPQLIKKEYNNSNSYSYNIILTKDIHSKKYIILKWRYPSFPTNKCFNDNWR